MAPDGNIRDSPAPDTKRSQSGRQRRSRSRSTDRNGRTQRRRDRSHSRTRALASTGDTERFQNNPERSGHHRRRVSRSRSRQRDREEGARPPKSDRHHTSHHHHHHRHTSHPDRSDRHKPSRSRSRSRSPKRRRRSHSPTSPPPTRRSRAPLPSQEASLQLAQGHSASVAAPKPKEKANFKPTGLLAAETNKVTVGNGPNATEIVLKYHEPAEARKPPSSDKWTLFVFKGATRDPLETIYLHERSCWLFGREAAVADVAIAHPSCSKQHAVLQFRYTTKRDEFGERKGKVGLYLLDLESSNGTWLNGERVESARYVGVLSGDVVRFGDSEREYVLLLPPKGG